MTVKAPWFALLLGFVFNAHAQFDCFPEDVLPENYFPSVKLETSEGDIVVELNRMRAPVTANNFLRYVLDGHYDGTVFHRVIADFVVQGGGYTERFEEKPVRDPIINESGNGLRNATMSVAMARYDDPHSATSQFFFNLKDNEALDPSPSRWGYTVFGEVVSGREVVEKIAAVDTGFSDALGAPDVPVTPVRLIRATVVDAP